jgi:hypothetical protein
MLRFYAEPFLVFARSFGRWEQLSHQHRNSKELDEELDEAGRKFNKDWMEAIRKRCDEIGLALASDQLLRMEIANKAPTVTQRHWQELQQELANRINDELSHKLLFWIPTEKGKFFLQKGDLFGDAVKNAFPSAQTDIEEAGKCYAAGRNTASVFHLMRVVEFGLRILGKSLNEPRLDPTRNPTWETILRRCDDELKLPIKERSDVWKAKNQFFSEATANLRAVKDAWRNPTLHVERDYDEEKALDVLNSVGAFMRHLSTELTDKSE